MTRNESQLAEGFARVHSQVLMIFVRGMHLFSIVFLMAENNGFLRAAHWKWLFRRYSWAGRWVKEFSIKGAYSYF